MRFLANRNQHTFHATAFAISSLAGRCATRAICKPSAPPYGPETTRAFSIRRCQSFITAHTGERMICQLCALAPATPSRNRQRCRMESAQISFCEKAHFENGFGTHSMRQRWLLLLQLVSAAGVRLPFFRPGSWGQASGVQPGQRALAS